MTIYESLVLRDVTGATLKMLMIDWIWGIQWFKSDPYISIFLNWGNFYQKIPSGYWTAYIYRRFAITLMNFFFVIGKTCIQIGYDSFARVPVIPTVKKIAESTTENKKKKKIRRKGRSKSKTKKKSESPSKSQSKSPRKDKHKK